MRLPTAALLALSLALPAAAQDYERERRWAAEVVPNLVVGDAVSLKLPGGREFLGLYAESQGSAAGVLLVHGIGVHPDHGVIGILRASLAEAGLTTLSIQMPVLAADAPPRDYYPKALPEAAERIEAGARWLADKGQRTMVLLSHSLGSRMSNAYYEKSAHPPFAAWICMGLGGAFGGMSNVTVPVLDVYGENDLPAVMRDDWRRRFTLNGIEGSRQVKIAGADHFYTGKEAELGALVREFIGALR